MAFRCSSTGMRVFDRRRHVGQKNVCVSGERFLRWFPCVARYLEKGRNRKEKPCQTDEQKTHARWKHVSNAFCAYASFCFLSVSFLLFALTFFFCLPTLLCLSFYHPLNEEKSLMDIVRHKLQRPCVKGAIFCVGFPLRGEVSMENAKNTK